MVTSDSDCRAEGNLLRLVVKVVNIPVQGHRPNRLQREVLLWPHLVQGFKTLSSKLDSFLCLMNLGSEMQRPESRIIATRGCIEIRVL